MQATTPVFEERINWALGLRGLLVAFSLAGVSAGSGSPLPFYAAVLVGGWAIVKPLRFSSWALAPATLRFVGLMAARGVALALAAFALSFAVNSEVTALAALGNVLFLALLGVVAATAGWAAWARASRWAPRAWSWGGETAGRTRAQAAAVWGAMVSR